MAVSADKSSAKPEAHAQDAAATRLSRLLEYELELRGLNVAELDVSADGEPSDSSPDELKPKIQRLPHAWGSPTTFLKLAEPANPIFGAILADPPDMPSAVIPDKSAMWSATMGSSSTVDAHVDTTTKSPAESFCVTAEPVRKHTGRNLFEGSTTVESRQHGLALDDTIEKTRSASPPRGGPWRITTCHNARPLATSAAHSSRANGLTVDERGQSHIQPGTRIDAAVAAVSSVGGLPIERLERTRETEETAYSLQIQYQQRQKQQALVRLGQATASMSSASLHVSDL